MRDEIAKTATSAAVNHWPTPLNLYILTCKPRIEGGITQSTLDSIARSDWGKAVELCVQDDDIIGDPRDSLTENYRRLLERVVAEAPAYALILEDDVQVNRYLRHNLGHWLTELRDIPDFLASLYNPNVRPLASSVSVVDGFVADPESVYGSQAFILTVPVAIHCLRHWYDIQGMQDIKLSRYITGMPSVPVIYHRPSLVQHNIEASSTHGGTTHYAEDFDPWWRADRAQWGAEAGQSWERIPGWFDWARFYEERVRALPHRAIIVEVGSFLGRSIIYLSQTMKRYRKDLQLVTVDTFVGSKSDPIVLDAVAREGGSLRNAFEANLRLSDVQDCIEVMAMEPVSAARQFADRSVAVVFLDGDHSYAGVTATLLAWLPKVRPWGHLAGHDIDTYASVGQAIADVLGFECVWIDHSQNLWVFHNTPENQGRLKPISRKVLGL